MFDENLNPNEEILSTGEEAAAETESPVSEASAAAGIDEAALNETSSADTVFTEATEEPGSSADTVSAEATDTETAAPENADADTASADTAAAASGEAETASENTTQAQQENVVYHAYHITEDNYTTDSANAKTAKKAKKARKAKSHGAAFWVRTVAAGLIFGIAAFGSIRGLSAIFPEKAAEVKKTVNISQVGNADGSNVSSVVTATDSHTVYDVSAVVKEVMPAVVSIECKGTQTVMTFFGQQEQPMQGAGTGIIVGNNDEELLIATNNHVIANADELKVTLTDDSSAAAYVKGTSSDVDLAVIAVKLSDLSDDAKEAIKVATLGDSEKLVVGEPTIAIGNALGYGQSVTSGIVSALDRAVTVTTDDSYGFGNSQTITSYLIQTDAAINPGNSGGPLLNSKGEVIGINSVKYEDSSVEGMGYAIPINKALPILEDLMTRETKTKVAEDEQSALGISGTNVTSDASMVYGMPSGVFVAQVIEGGGAEKAGMKRGDIICELDGTKISSMNDLTEELLYHAAGTKVDVVIYRNTDGEYQKMTLNVKLGAKADLDD